MASLGEADARYIHRVIAAQRGLEVGGRGALLFSLFPPAWLLGTARAGRGQDPGQHGDRAQRPARPVGLDARPARSTRRPGSGTTPAPAASWKKSHNYEHHTFTNVRGKDRDLGYAVMRITPEQEWKPVDLLQPLTNLGLSLIFEWGIAIYDIELEKVQEGTKPWSQAKAELKTLWRKAPQAARQGLPAVPAAVRPRLPAHRGGQPHRQRRSATSGRTR